MLLKRPKTLFLHLFWQQDRLRQKMHKGHNMVGLKKKKELMLDVNVIFYYYQLSSFSSNKFYLLFKTHYDNRSKSDIINFHSYVWNLNFIKKIEQYNTFTTRLPLLWTWFLTNPRSKGQERWCWWCTDRPYLCSDGSEIKQYFHQICIDYQL